MAKLDKPFNARPQPVAPTAAAVPAGMKVDAIGICWESEPAPALKPWELPKANEAETEQAARKLVQQLTQVPAAVTTVRTAPLGWPPGLIGELAQFIYSSANRPVREVAIVAALAWMSGVCGKAWDTGTDSGLNLYLILVARSAMGKEALHSGLNLWTKELASGPLNLHNPVDCTEHVSAPALAKACASAPGGSLVNLTGELGRKLKRMASPRDEVAQALRTLLTNLFQKSGKDSTVGALAYSDKTKNSVEVRDGIAFSLVGETTVETFLELLTPEMMDDGFVSRFLTVEAEGGS